MKVLISFLVIFVGSQVYGADVVSIKDINALLENDSSYGGWPKFGGEFIEAFRSKKSEHALKKESSFDRLLGRLEVDYNNLEEEVKVRLREINSTFAKMQEYNESESNKQFVDAALANLTDYYKVKRRYLKEKFDQKAFNNRMILGSQLDRHKESFGNSKAALIRDLAAPGPYIAENAWLFPDDYNHDNWLNKISAQSLAENSLNGFREYLGEYLACAKDFCQKKPGCDRPIANFQTKQFVVNNCYDKWNGSCVETLKKVFGDTYMLALPDPEKNHCGKVAGKIVEQRFYTSEIYENAREVVRERYNVPEAQAETVPRGIAGSAR